MRGNVIKSECIIYPGPPSTNGLAIIRGLRAALEDLEKNSYEKGPQFTDCFSVSMIETVGQI